jgi:hypothetical protein
VFTALGFSVEEAAGAGNWQKPYTAGQRWLLQQWGTEFRRSQDPQYWVKYGLDYITERYQDGDIWCVTDVRFANEAEAIQDAGGVVVRVQAAPPIRAKRLGVGLHELEQRSKHASEVIDFNADHYVVNDKSLVMPPYLLEYLGLPGGCFWCAIVQPHLFHDNGVAFAKDADFMQEAGLL